MEEKYSIKKANTISEYNKREDDMFQPRKSLSDDVAKRANKKIFSTNEESLKKYLDLDKSGLQVNKEVEQYNKDRSKIPREAAEKAKGKTYDSESLDERIRSTRDKDVLKTIKESNEFIYGINKTNALEERITKVEQDVRDVKKDTSNILDLLERKLKGGKKKTRKIIRKKVKKTRVKKNKNKTFRKR